MSTKQNEQAGETTGEVDDAVPAADDAAPADDEGANGEEENQEEEEKEPEIQKLPLWPGVLPVVLPVDTGKSDSRVVPDDYLSSVEAAAKKAAEARSNSAATPLDTL